MNWSNAHWNWAGTTCTPHCFCSVPSGAMIALNSDDSCGWALV